MFCVKIDANLQQISLEFDLKWEGTNSMKKSSHQHDVCASHQNVKKSSHQHDVCGLS